MRLHNVFAALLFSLLGIAVTAILDTLKNHKEQKEKDQQKQKQYAKEQDEKAKSVSQVYAHFLRIIVGFEELIKLKSQGRSQKELDTLGIK